MNMMIILDKSKEEKWYKLDSGYM